MRINFLLCLVITALAAGGGPAAASGLVLASGKLTVTLSRATGQVVSITENGHGAVLAESEDRYVFNDRPSGESKDVVHW